MLLFFTGTHGSGKTTLGREVAKAFDLPFYESRASLAFKKASASFADATNLSLDDRLAIQCEIYSFWSEDVAKAMHDGAGVFDRCPSDFAAYMLAEAPSSLDDKTSDRIESYIQSCLDTLPALDNILLVQPHGAVMVQRGEDKPLVNNSAYSRKIHCLIHGLLLQSHGRFSIIPATDLGNRLDMMTRYVNDKFDETADEIKTEAQGKASLPFSAIQNLH